MCWVSVAPAAVVAWVDWAARQRETSVRLSRAFQVADDLW